MTRPVDVDGTPLHVGDLVRGTWHPEAADTGPWTILRRLSGGLVIDDDPDYASVPYNPLSACVTKVPETRHERIVRRSHERPQVVRIQMAGGPANALIAAGRAYGFESASLADIVAAVHEEGQDFIDQLLYAHGTWTVL